MNLICESLQEKYTENYLNHLQVSRRNAQATELYSQTDRWPDRLRKTDRQKEADRNEDKLQETE